MPRRIPDYPDAFAGWNMVSSIGSFISMAAAFFFVFVVIYTLLRGKKAEANPWGPYANTLEWTVSSPPPFHTFEELPNIED
jgi:cytochrome c oxidase subunit 1